jgi:chromosome segregation ATPase
MALKDSLKPEGGLNSALEAAEAALSQQQQLAEQQRSAEANLSSETLALDQALAKAEAGIEELNKQASNLRNHVEDAEFALKREQARLQRLGIEQRNIEQASPPESRPSARLGELMQQAQALAPQIDLAQDSVNSALAALEETTAAIEEKASHVRELKRRKDLLGRSLSSQLRQVSEAADGANERQRKALADLGRSILATRGRIAVHDATLREVARHDEAVATIWRRQRVYSLALDNFDSAAVKRGTQLSIGFLAFIVLFLVWKLIHQ